MITLIHCDDIAASRNYYFELKSKFTDATVLDGTKITVTDLTQALEGQDLFGDAKQILIEELFSKKKSPKELESLSSLLLTHNSSPITLWESKELTSKQTSPLKGATIKVFKIPATIFAFMDAFKPKNGKELIHLFHKTLKDKDEEFVFFMLQRQVRMLLALNSSHPGETTISIGSSPKDSIASLQNDNKATISEVFRIAPWQKGKLGKQASLFGQEQLLNLHSSLFDIEYGLKTGNLPQPLIPTIDLLLVNL